MKFFEFIYYDENGCVWDFQDGYENSVVIKADNYKEAEAKLLANVDSDYEEEAKKYYAREIEDIESYREYRENHVIWD